MIHSLRLAWVWGGSNERPRPASDEEAGYGLDTEAVEAAGAGNCRFGGIAAPDG